LDIPNDFLRRVEKTIPDVNALLSKHFKEHGGLNHEMVDNVVRDLVLRLLGEFTQKELPKVIRNEYQATLIIVGEKIRGLEEWREESGRKEEVDRARREEASKRMEAMQDEIYVLKKGRNDAYH
jgi:hypothetical protein